MIAKEKVPSLINKQGYFYNFEQMPEFLAQLRLDKLEMEFRAQIELMLEVGLKPTHLDWHALRISGRRDILELMLLLAREYGVAHIRQTDFNFLTSQQAKEIVEQEGIILLDYRALQDVWKKKGVHRKNSL